MSSLISIGDQILAGKYCLHSSFERAANFSAGGRLVCLATPEIGAGPVNIVVDGIDFSTIQELTISNSHINLGNHRLPVDADLTYHSDITALPINQITFPATLNRFESIFLELAPGKSLAVLLDDRRKTFFKSGFEREFVKRLILGAICLQNGHWRDGIAKMKGCGIGLTPAGDDFIAGMLLGLNFMKNVPGLLFPAAIGEILEISKSDNLLVQSMITLAGDGRTIEPMKNLLTALGSGNLEDINSLIRKLMAVGSTSGADLTAGWLFMMRLIIQTEPR